MSTKQPSNPRFGKLLTEAISSVAKRKRLNMEVVEEEIALAVSRAEELDAPLSFYTVQRWMRGYPPNGQRLMIVLDFCIRYGRIGHDLARSLAVEAGSQHLLTALDGQLDGATQSTATRFYTNLPRRHLSFRGRVQELRELHRLLAPDSRAAVVVVYGIGGVGKTSLVVEAVHQLVTHGGQMYDAVIFTSARDSQLCLTDVLNEIGR